MSLVPVPQSNNVNRVMPRTRSPWIAALALVCTTVLAGCAVKYAEVREEAFRSEKDKGSRIALPLNDASATNLVEFLHRLDRDQMRPTGKSPDDDPVYGSLVRTLRDSNNLQVAALKPRSRFCQIAVKICGQTRLFRGRSASLDVIDAREPKAVFPFPIAVSDGRFWWIFYHSQNEKGQDQFQKLLVTLIPPGKP